MAIPLLLQGQITPVLLWLEMEGFWLGGQLAPLMLPLVSKDGKFAVASKYVGSIFGVSNLDRCKLFKHHSIYLKKKKR